MLKTKDKITVTNKSENTLPSLHFKPIVKGSLAFLFGFLLMNCFVVGELAPFAVSLIAALSGGLCFAATIGTVIGAFVFFELTDTVKYIVIALFCCMINELSERKLDAELKKYVPYINSFCCVFIIGTSIMLATGFEIETFVTVLYEALLCCVGTYIFISGNALIFGRKELSHFTTRELAVTIAGCGILLMSFYKYTVLGFSFVGVIFSLTVLVLGRLKSGIGGTVSGICLGVCVGLSGQVGFFAVGYAVAGFVCGELSRKGKYFSAIGFTVILAVGALIDSSLKAYLGIAEAVVAVLIFLLVPDRIYARLSEKINTPLPSFTVKDGSRALTQRLSEVSGAIGEISECVSTVQRTLAPSSEKEHFLAIRSTWESICASCENCKSCHEEMRRPSDETIENLALAMDSQIELGAMHFPKGFSAECCRFDEMVNRIKLRHISHVASLGVQGKLDQIQGLMSDQFKSISDILRDIACDFDSENSFSGDISEICKNEAKENGLTVLDSSCRIDKYGRVTVCIDALRPRESFNITKFTERLSIATGTELDLPELDDRDNECTLIFKQRMSFEVEIGAYSRSADGIKVCGDYYRSFRDSEGRYITVLSDGMGTGSRAAVDSAMAAELFTKLVKAGLSFDCALSITNSALLVKSSDESLATLDVVCVDLYSGRTDFYKAGAAAGFICHKGKVAALEQASLPVGILREVNFSKATARLSHGDTVLMVSDGILNDYNAWINQELTLSDSARSPKELAQSIVSSACERRTDKHRDDMTAIVIRII